ncbi:tannase/feruloyl esterase family alpha/beta hydrolase [Rubrivivax rivuli]|uniref:Tannase/feruloyl esterase family alpha/beta hydrolase n=1 Tax=Rubrivivax rivuli TaxID=1862385 RepID=A0A437R8B6_9BURK|nr:tannase/feruloyl esterase family alpha/beta hydrolase [Rubrivivax rivuli]RVU43036.1 tannase/feruloyl esterase family alpha/beta hydrolase [Rubrivivax rivuli]
MILKSIAATLLALPLLAAAAPDCAALAGLRLPQAVIDLAVAVAQGEKLAVWRGGSPVPMPQAFCRVRGVAMPVPGSRIGFEVWLPERARWNGKFMQAGNGGTAGSVPLGSLMDGVRRGYAAAATDGGHEWPDGLDYGWAWQQPTRVVDFGWRAVQQTSQVARRVIAAAYARAPRKSYFVGCSNGGRDAMIAAQRFPKEWDGIVAGAPAMDWLGLMIGGAMLQRELTQPGAGLPPAKLPALQAAALAACGEGQSYVVRPQQCRFDPAVLRCTGAETDACLTDAQLATVRKVYGGVTDASGTRIPGQSMGGEASPGNWDFWLLRRPSNPLSGEAAAPGTPPPTSISESFFRYLVREDAAFQLGDLRDEDVLKARQRWSRDLDATDPDLRAFRARGGKLLHYHGWNDGAIPPQMSIDYRQRVAARLGNEPDDFYRLFLVPGMNHCGGGAGPWQVDWVDVLERWVERHEVPAALTALHPQTGATQILRPQAPAERP